MRVHSGKCAVFGLVVLPVWCHAPASTVTVVYFYPPWPGPWRGVWTRRQWKPHFSSFPIFYSASKFASGKRCTSAWRIKMESVQNPQAIISSWRTVFLADCLPECVSPHMGLFLAGGNCALVCVLAGVGIWRRAPEKTSCLLS